MSLGKLKDNSQRSNAWGGKLGSAGVSNAKDSLHSTKISGSLYGSSNMMLKDQHLLVAVPLMASSSNSMDLCDTSSCTTTHTSTGPASVAM